jgi:hypothetical protein
MSFNKIQKNSLKNFNVSILCVCIFFILLPIISYFIKLTIPDIYNYLRCPYYKLTNQPCPFCGITTDFNNILHLNIFAYKYNLISIPLFILGILELLFRIIAIKNKSKIKPIVIYTDIIVHFILFIMLITYIVLFFKLNLARL